MDPHTASNLGALIMSAVSFLAFLKLNRTYRENEIHTVGYLGYFFAFYGAFQLMIGSRIFLLDLLGSYTTYWYIGAHMLMYFSLAFFSRISTYLLRPSWEAPVFLTNIWAGGLLVSTMIYIGEPVTALIGAPALINWIGLGALPFAYMAYNQEGTARIKMLMLAGGFTLIALAGPLHNIIETGTGRLAINLMTVGGTILAMLGVYLRNIIHSENKSQEE
jgi:hypothetical protein